MSVNLSLSKIQSGYLVTFSFWEKKRKNAFFQEYVFVNQSLNKFFVCVWTARRTILKNI